MPQPSTHRPKYFPAIILLAALVAFWPALRNGYVHDDYPQVERLDMPSTAAQWLASPAQPWWPPTHHKNLWRPLTRITILIQKAVHRDLSWPFFALNILLHGIASFLLYRLARRIGFNETAALFAALAFAIHPVHAEAVHQIVGRAEILVVIWTLLGLLLCNHSPRAFLLQPLCFALALASKESAVVYPFLLALFLISTDGFAILKQARFWLLLLLLGIVLTLFLAAKSAITGGLLEPASTVPFFENPLAHMSFAGRLPAALGILFYAAWQTLLPSGLCPDYSAWSFPVQSGWRWPLSWAGAFLILILTLYTIFNARSGKRGWLIAAAALGAWLPLSNIVFPIGTITAERLWYLPSAAACLAIGCALSRIWSVGQVRSARLLPIALLFSWFVTSLIYAQAWASQTGFATWTISRFPNSWRGHVNMAREDYHAFRFESGMKEARIAIELMPNMALGWSWLGTNAAFTDRQYWPEAERALEHALALDPGFAEPHQQIATLYQMQGRNAEALRHLEIYLASGEALDPDSIRRRIAKLQLPAK